MSAITLPVHVKMSVQTQKALTHVLVVVVTTMLQRMADVQVVYILKTIQLSCKLDTNHNSADVNECATPGLCQHTCHNLVGGYHCTCDTGYRLVNGHNCTGKFLCFNEV